RGGAVRAGSMPSSAATEPDAQTPPSRCQIAVIGAGIIGLAVGRELLKRLPRSTLCVFEKERCVGAHQTGHSSGVIHARIYYKPGSLKAHLCVRGARALQRYCAERDVA